MENRKAKVKKMSDTFKLFQIDQDIQGLLDSDSSYSGETGEILPEVREKLETLTQSRSDLIYDLAQYNLYCSDLEEMVKKEIRRLQTIQSKLQKKSESVKKMLKAFVPEGENVDFGTVKISWRKSSHVVTDEVLDLVELEKACPQLVKHSRELKKEEVKKYFKATGLVPLGCEIIEKNNLIIG
ncbi:MAG: siphovirus Gp157 family protein [Syntrophomonadaceae bacterium]